MESFFSEGAVLFVKEATKYYIMATIPYSSKEYLSNFTNRAKISPLSHCKVDFLAKWPSSIYKKHKERYSE